MTISLEVLSTREGVLMYPNQAAEEIENGGTFIAEVTYETLSTRAGVLRFPQEAANRILEIAASSSSSSPLLNGLVSYYKFLSNGNDSVSENNLNIASGTLITGKINGALNTGVALGDFELQSVTDLTISLWINLGTDATDSTLKAGFIRLTSSTNQILELSWSDRDGNDIEVRWYHDISPAEDTKTTTYSAVTSDNQWIHVVVTSGSEFNLYIDGQYLNNDNQQPMPDDIISIVVNCWEDYTSKAGDIGIWSRLLSEEEILQLYNSGNGLDPTA